MYCNVSTVSRSVSISAFASSNIDFCHSQDIGPLITGKLLDILAKAGLDVSKATSKNVVHKRAEETKELIKKKIDEKFVKPKHMPESNSRNFG